MTVAACECARVAKNFSTYGPNRLVPLNAGDEVSNFMRSTSLLATTSPNVRPSMFSCNVVFCCKTFGSAGLPVLLGR